MLLIGSVSRFLRGQQVWRGFILLFSGRVIEVNKCQTGYNLLLTTQRGSGIWSYTFLKAGAIWWIRLCKHQAQASKGESKLWLQGLHSQYLVCKSSRHNNDIGLSGRGTEHNSISGDEIFTTWHIYPITESKKEAYQPVLTCPCRILGRQCASSPQRNRPIQKSEATESLFWRGGEILERAQSLGTKKCREFQK